MKAAAEDVTVLRTDLSLSGRRGGGGASAPRVLKQRFVLDEKLGSGGMGTVFRAKDLRKVEARDRNPFVAVKVLNNDFREHPEAFIALQREATKSQGLSHRNIVTIYDFDKDGDIPFIIMELLEGQELADKLRAFPTGLPEDMLWSIVRCMCDGLEHAHEGGLVHADFKPGNVFVAPDNTAKILDFGIARAVQVNQASGGFGDETVFDPTRLAALTPAYASPQMLDGAEAEVRDDLFSLGVVIYLMATGQHPYGRVPANEAARQQLRPERPRGLSRRQWRGLERCLAFDRDQRPASVAEVKQYLFQPSPWRSRTALVALAAVLLTVAVSGIKEEAAVEEARVEVRQTTLVDAQLARLEALLQEPRFDAAWEAQVGEEVSGLLALRGPDQPEPAVVVQLRQRYLERIVASDDRARAVALFNRGRRYGPMPRAEAYLRQRLTADTSLLLDAPTLDGSWLDQLDLALSRLASLFPGTMELEQVRLEAVAVLQAELEASLAAEQFPAANRALAYLEAYGFTPALVDGLRARVEQDRRSHLARQDREAVAADRQQFLGELDRSLASGTCLQFDPAPAAAVLNRWITRRPAFETQGRARVGDHVGRCLAQLEALDRDRALVLKSRAQAAFGPLPGLDGLRDDPCAAAYLVGSGSQGGRRGSCADRLGAAGQGPRLVVVPAAAAESRFAITRQEVSWGELNVFCSATGRCEPGQELEQPAAGIPADLARAYAAWLSERSGFHYRLPTYREWRQAAGNDSDPNRNCQVQLGSVHRGLAPVAVSTGAPNAYGLVNVLGNVQEWVVDADQLKAAGGGFRDPIAVCAVTTLRSQSGEPDPTTGFRLVREVT